MSSEKGILLKVQEIDPREVAKGIARVSINAMDYLGASEGDPLVIINRKDYVASREAKKRTVAKCLPMTTAAENEKDAIKLDGLARKNAGAWIGDSVLARKARAVPAKQVTFKLMENISLDRLLSYVDSRDIKKIIFADFESAYVVKGDMIYPSVPNSGGGRVAFVVEGIEPKIAEVDENIAALMTKENTIIEITSTA